VSSAAAFDRIEAVLLAHIYFGDIVHFYVCDCSQQNHNVNIDQTGINDCGDHALPTGAQTIDDAEAATGICRDRKRIRERRNRMRDG